MVSGKDKANKANVIIGFAPMTAGTGAEEDRYDLIITTDVLAEGVNLQQARNIVNYDLPWNPMRLVQRSGRIDRIGSPHSEIFIRCFFPDADLDKILLLEERLKRKLKQAAAAVGHAEVLPGMDPVERVITDTLSRSTSCAARKQPSSRTAARDRSQGRNTAAGSRTRSSRRHQGPGARPTLGRRDRLRPRRRDAGARVLRPDR